MWCCVHSNLCDTRMTALPHWVNSSLHATLHMPHLTREPSGVLYPGMPYRQKDSRLFLHNVQGLKHHVLWHHSAVILHNFMIYVGLHPSLGSDCSVRTRQQDNCRKKGRLLQTAVNKIELYTTTFYKEIVAAVLCHAIMTIAQGSGYLGYS